MADNRININRPSLEMLISAQTARGKCFAIATGQRETEASRSLLERLKVYFIAHLSGELVD